MWLKSPYFTATMKVSENSLSVESWTQKFIAGHEKSHTASMGTDNILCSYKVLPSFLNPSKQIFRGLSLRQSVKTSKKGTGSVFTLWSCNVYA